MDIKQLTEEMDSFVRSKDVALYLLELASVTGIDLEEAILNKLKVNKTREWDQE